MVEDNICERLEDLRIKHEQGISTSDMNIRQAKIDIRENRKKVDQLDAQIRVLEAVQTGLGAAGRMTNPLAGTIVEGTGQIVAGVKLERLKSELSSAQSALDQANADLEHWSKEFENHTGNLETTRLDKIRFGCVS